jgi:hypothetical protein
MMPASRMPAYNTAGWRALGCVLSENPTLPLMRTFAQCLDASARCVADERLNLLRCSSHE